MYGRSRPTYNDRPITYHVKQLFCDEVPAEGNQWNHTCDNGICLNPDHLYEGTQSQNMIDRRKAGRMNAKLTDDQVRNLFRACRTGSMSRAYAAERYGLPRRYIEDLMNGKKFKDVIDPLR